MNWLLAVEIKDAMQCAREESAQLGHRYIGTKHILLGLLRDSSGKVGVLLDSMGADLDAIRQAVKDLEPTHTNLSGSPESSPITPRARQVLEIAADEAEDLKAEQVYPEHLLLALLRDKNSASAKVLKMQDFDYHSVREAVTSRAGLELGSK